MAVVALVVGVALLAWAADQFVLGAARLSVALRLSPVLIGAVVIGFGTSLPEMLVSGLAAVQGDIDLGVGNIVGSNIANLALVLGIAALVGTVGVAHGTIRREIPLAAAACLLFVVVAWSGITRLDAVLLSVAMVAFLTVLFLAGRAGGDESLEAEVAEYVEAGFRRLGIEGLRTLLGLLGTIAGAQALVWGAREIATAWGLSEGFVGLTIVAVGTSLPELVTAVAAVRRREDDLLVGNLLGSNVFNALGVAAVMGFAGPGPLVDAAVAHRGMIVMLIVVALASALMIRGKTVSRRDGALLLVLYGVSIPLLLVL